MLYTTVVGQIRGLIGVDVKYGDINSEVFVKN